MTYATQQSGLSSYYEFEPHQVFDGIGAYYEYDTNQIFRGFGQVDFNASIAWDGWRRGAECQAIRIWEHPSCLAIKDAVESIRGALNQLGYGPLRAGAPWGPPDQEAWKKFVYDHNVSPGSVIPTKDGLDAMQRALSADAAAAPPEGMSSATAVTIALVGVAVVGGLVFVMRKKKRR